MRTLTKIFRYILVFLILSGVLFLPMRVVQASLLSSLSSIFTGEQAYAETSPDTVKPPKSGDNIQNLKFSLQANVSYASYLQNKDNTDNTSANTDNISDDEKAFFPQNNGRDTSDSSVVEMIVYRVESGDTLSGLEERFHTSIDTIRWENNIPGQKISVGQKLNIFPDFIGIKHIVKSGDTIAKIADKYEADAEEIFTLNEISNGDTLKPGDIIFVPYGIKLVVSKSTFSSSSSYTPSSNTKVESGRYIKPAQGVITSPYGPRKRGFHYGIDIGNVRETPVVSAINGVVTKVVTGCIEGRKSCGSGYGNHIEIVDSLGNKARYSHLSKIFVSVGQSVSQGEKIATMGSTGNSTGPHLDFSLENSNGSKIRPPI